MNIITNVINTNIHNTILPISFALFSNLILLPPEATRWVRIVSLLRLLRIVSIVVKFKETNSSKTKTLKNFKHVNLYLKQ